MRLDTDAIVCGTMAHGEHGAIVRLLTPDHGLIAAYVRGGRGRRMSPVLIPGNVVSAHMRWRSESQLPQATLELVHSRAPILAEPLPSAAVEWATVLAAAALPERQSHPRIHGALAGLLDAVEAAPSASGWGGALARFELLVVAELGYGGPAESLPPWLGDGRGMDWKDIHAALELSGASLFREILVDRTSSLRSCRARLVDRLERMSP